MLDPTALLEDLNEPQREAVTSGDGPLLVVAGAGSGKTRVITRRVAWLIAQGVPPWSILAITFTNKAAGEMRERVADLVGDGRVWMMTFHGFCARVLRTDGEPVGLRSGFSIYDRDDQIALVKDVCARLAIDTQQNKPRSLVSAISRWKNDGLLVEDAYRASGSPYEQSIAEVYEHYQAALEEANAADFDDLLLKVRKLFAEHEDVLAKYQERFRYVLVDEYQDTNPTQDEIARAVAAGAGNLCVTGDPNQSIYGWRGARIENILEFERDYPDVKVVRLEQNYRSTNHILAAASGVIRQNGDQLMGDLWSELGDGAQVEVIGTDDEEREADLVVRMIKDLADQGTPLSDMAVFYRTNSLSRPFERAMRLHNVPYDLVGALEFYERKEVKDVLAYLRVLANPDDAVAFLRIVNTPTRGIGKTSLEKLRAWAVPMGLTPRAAARRANEAPGLTARARKALMGFSVLLDELEAYVAEHPLEAAFEQVIASTQFAEYLADFGGQEAIDRQDNVDELQGAIAAYVRSHEEPSLTGFLEETALIADADTYEAAPDRLVFMTLHAAKGLEFPVVFMAGLEEGLLPHVRSFEGDGSVDEERRLCYVGMTRARERLVMTWAGRRPVRGMWMDAEPSRFLTEVPEDHVQVFDRRVGDSWGGGRGGGGRSGSRGRQGGLGGWQRPRGNDAVAETVYVPSPDDYVDAPAAEMDTGEMLPQPNQAVRHPHFGEGVVVAVQGSGPKARITVRFRAFGEKQLIAEYARLEAEF